jgi:hypothetical protein
MRHVPHRNAPQCIAPHRNALQCTAPHRTARILVSVSAFVVFVVLAVVVFMWQALPIEAYRSVVLLCALACIFRLSYQPSAVAILQYCNTLPLPLPTLTPARSTVPARSPNSIATDRTKRITSASRHDDTAVAVAGKPPNDATTGKPTRNLFCPTGTQARTCKRASARTAIKGHAHSSDRHIYILNSQRAKRHVIAQIAPSTQYPPPSTSTGNRSSIPPTVPGPPPPQQQHQLPPPPQTPPPPPPSPLDL